VKLPPPHMVSQNSNRYQQFAIFIQLIACFTKRFETFSGAPKNQNIVRGPSLRMREHNTPSVILGTALVHILDRAGTHQSVRALVDSASQVSAITYACTSLLGLRCSTWTAPLSGLSGVPVPDVKGRVDCQIQPHFSTEPVLRSKA